MFPFSLNRLSVCLVLSHLFLEHKTYTDGIMSGTHFIKIISQAILD